MFNAINLTLSFVYKSAMLLLAWCLILSMGMAHAGNQLGHDRVMRFAVIYTDEKPFVYSNEESKYNGFVPKLVEALGRELNFKVEYLPTSRKGLEASVIAGKADFSWLSKEWVDHGENLIFSAPVLKHREFLYSLQPFMTSDNPADYVRAKTICVHQDYKYPMLAPFFEQQIAKPITVSSQAHITDLFLSKKCDLLYTNEYRANWAFQDLSPTIKIFRSEQPLEQTYQTFMFHKSFQAEMPKINQAIARLIQSGEITKIVDNQIYLNTSK